MIMIVFILLILLILFILLTLYSRNSKKEEKEKIEKRGILPLRVYCISLEERRDRRDAFLKRMEDRKNRKYMSFLEIEMVNAVPYSSLTNSYFATKEMTCMTPGALGCLLSHMYVCLKFLSTRQPLALVMEDDAECVSSSLFSILQEINKDYLHSFSSPSFSVQNYRILGKYDLLFLGVTFCVKDEKVCDWWMNFPLSASDIRDIRDENEFSYLFGTHAYLMTQRSANLIISQVLPLKKHYDMFLSDPELWKKFDLKCGVLTKSICMPVNPYDSNTN